LCKQCQNGRVSENLTSVTFDFSEGWFRTSGLYDLTEQYQLKLFDSFKTDKFNWNKSKVQSESAKYKRWQEFICYAENKLLTNEDLPLVTKLIENDTFKTIDQLQDKLNGLNKKASNKLICGDSIQELEKLDDCSIDIVITDPPYGIDYDSNYSKYNEYVTKTGILNDGLEDALNLLDSVCEVLNRKTKQDAHLYICTGWKYNNEFKTIIEKYFSVKNCIIWDKGNASMGDLEGSWGNSYEMIFFATKGNKKINTRKHDVINISRVPTVKAIHPTQKPEGLIKTLLEVSAQAADIVCDPFMGSGSTIKAIKEYGNLNYIGIELDKDRFDKAKAYIGGDIL
jgi:DNA modification methylase